MRLLEYEAKSLLSAHGAPIPTGQLVTDRHQTALAPFPLVMKIQIPIGGRGKAGGVTSVYTSHEFQDVVKRFLSEPMLGYRARAVLAEEELSIKRELYLAITLDRSSHGFAVLAHKIGGIGIEAASKESEALIIPLPQGPTDAIQQQLLEYVGLPENIRQSLANIVNALWAVSIQEDAMLVEVNPLIVTNDDRLVCADAKIELDDAAHFRHNREFEQRPANTQFVILNEHGTIGSMANGAGLAMATVDAIQGAGGKAANFLDVGGGTNTEGMVRAFQSISELSSVRAIVVNIFGGITRCDEVAEAIVRARATLPQLPPLFIRLAGTNEARATQILSDAGISTLPNLSACVQAATQELSNV